MKRLLLIVLPLLLIVGCSKPINENSLIDRNGVKYQQDSQKPYNGKVFRLYDTGENKNKGIYKDGKLDGLWIEWYENGQKKEEGTYKDGKSIGKWTYWNEDGLKIFPIIPDVVTVKGGTFKMGSNSGDGDEKPVHSVTVSDYSMSKTEVTFEQYDAFCDATGRAKPDAEGWGRGDRPVINVSWHDAVAFCEWMSKVTGKTYRLPTEAEWEYAARGGNKSKGYKYSGGNDLDAVGWYDNNSGSKTHPVAQKQSNELGLYDMSGNVWEWCSDWFGDYSSSPQSDPQGSNSGDYRVLRGCCWYLNVNHCRVANRSRFNPDFRNDYFFGFRLVLSQD